MPDYPAYSEPVTALTPMSPVALRTRFQDGWQYRTLPGELVGPHLAIVPTEPVSPDWPGWEGRTRGFDVVHLPTGLFVPPRGLFLIWAREYAQRLVDMPGVDWAADSHTQILGAPGSPGRSRVYEVASEFIKRQDQLEVDCTRYATEAERSRAYRQLRALGAEYRPIP